MYGSSVKYICVWNLCESTVCIIFPFHSPDLQQSGANVQPVPQQGQVLQGQSAAATVQQGQQSSINIAPDQVLVQQGQHVPQAAPTYIIQGQLAGTLVQQAQNVPQVQQTPVHVVQPQDPNALLHQGQGSVGSGEAGAAYMPQITTGTTPLVQHAEGHAAAGQMPPIQHANVTQDPNAVQRVAPQAVQFQEVAGANVNPQAAPSGMVTPSSSCTAVASNVSFRSFKEPTNRQNM